MPLYKRKPFPLLEPPHDLSPNELVFQVRYTKELFRDYQDYLNRLNLYRQRVWTCKATWKSNLTYEEALVSEHRAAENVQQIPAQYLVPILQMVQFSTLTLTDLANAIVAKLQVYMFEGLELHGKKGESICPCRILKLENSGKQVTVGWLDKQKSISDTSIVDADCLIWKKHPISKSLLKSFIRESTFQNAPWVVHEKLAQKHGLGVDPPEELHNLIAGQNGNKNGFCFKKRKQANQDELPGEKKKKKHEREKEVIMEELIKYPIDDLLVKPGVNDPVFADRPSPSRDFKIYLNCVGDLLMVWDFCSSFGRVLNLWPFSLEDFEKAVCHKDGALVIMIETHSALLDVLIKDEGEYAMSIQSKRHKSKITLRNWNEYLCDFLELKPELRLSSHISTIKRGHYGLLDNQTKLGILHEIVNEVLQTDAIRSKLDEYHKRKLILAAARRAEAQSKRETNETEKGDFCQDDMTEGNIMLVSDVDAHRATSEGNHVEDGGCPAKDGKNLAPNDGSDDITENGDKKVEVYSRKFPKKLGQNSTINSELYDANDVETQTKKQTKKEKDSQEQEKKSDVKKQNCSKEREKQYLRTNSFGRDRDYNRYWFFHRDGRLFVESRDSKQWGFYSTKEELDAFMASLNPKGVRERELQLQLRKNYDKISSAMQKRSKEIVQRVLLEEAVLRRSTRVRAQPRDSPATAYLRYVNKWKEA